ncbi:MAG TPA: DUF4157 domain-containing protein [Pseudonocardiaceae bacterium]|nr:DUF4157 domain-containing protein [Pseudonocardiaceae bacterium]
MRVRFPPLLVSRRRRQAAAAPAEHIGGWREAAPLAVTVSLRPLTTVGARLGGTIRPLAGRGIAVPARLTVAVARPIDGRPTAHRLPEPAPTVPPRPAFPTPRLDQAPPARFGTPEPELDVEPDESSWTDDDSIAELRAILTAARRQATGPDAPEPSWEAPENPLPDNAEPGVIRQSWPAPGEPPVRLPWEHDEPDTPTAESRPSRPPASTGGQQSPTPPRPTVPGRTRVPAGSATPGRSRPVAPPTEPTPTPRRTRRLTLAESRRRGITARPGTDEPTPVEPAPPVTESADTPMPPALPAPPAPAITEPPSPDQPDEPGVPTLQWSARQDAAPDTPPDPVPDNPTADVAADPEPATPADPPPDLPPELSDGPVEIMRVSTTGRQVVTPHGPVVGRLPDVEPGGTIDPAPIAAAEAMPPAAPRTPPAPSASPAAEPVGPSDPAGPTAHVRPTPPRQAPERPLAEQAIRPPAERPAGRPRLGLGEPLHRPAPRPARPEITRPAPEPVDPPTADVAGTVEPMAWVVDGEFALAPVSAVRQTAPPTVLVDDQPEPWVDRDAPDPSRPRQVVTPDPPSRRPGLGAPITSRPGRPPAPDLSDVTVHRGPAVNEQARAWQARAFTRDGEIYLADGHDHREEQATLAHELIHVVQQRAHGGALPPEWTPAGRALEQEAAAAVHEFAPPQPSYEPQSSYEPQRYAEPQQFPPPQPAPLLVPAGVQREPDGLAALFPPQIQDPQPPPMPEPEAQPDVLADYHDQLIALCDKRTVDLNDSRSIGELAAKLYQPLRGLLRSELIVDRERAGLLSDFR